MTISVNYIERFIARVWAAQTMHPLLFWIRAIVLFGVLWVFVTRRIFWTPDVLFLILFGLFLVFGQVREFVSRFAPFVLLLLVYESFRSVANDLNTHVHYEAMPRFDQALFGTLPTSWLQNLLWHGHVQWYDFYFYTLYTLHFLAPVLAAVLIWKVRERFYWPYVTAFLLLSFSAFATYLAFPASPPWLASDHGYITHIHRISSDIWWAMGVHNFSDFYSSLAPNEVAAVPSLHAAYPFLLVLLIARAFGWRRAGWLMIYPVSVWIGVVYLGEHYMFDVLLGILYAFVSYRLTLAFFAWKEERGFSIRYALRTAALRSWVWLRRLALGDRP